MGRRPKNTKQKKKVPPLSSGDPARQKKKGESPQKGLFEQRVGKKKRTAASIMPKKKGGNGET